MGVVAPVSAVVTAVLPLLFGLFLEGLPGMLQMVGFGTAIVAVWLLSRPPQGGQAQLHQLALPVLAGLGFGTFLIVIDHVSDSARFASLTLLFLLVVFMRQRQWPAVRQLPLMIIAGLFDVGGNTFYALAARVGRLDTAAVLSSLFPGITVLLAWIVLKERLGHEQWAGVAVAMVAVLLIAS
jgi:drug/metabolite transporter (DMT)-like permease